MKEHGTLTGIPEKNQLSLFGNSWKTAIFMILFSMVYVEIF
jgi:hypothetical protein